MTIEITKVKQLAAEMAQFDTIPASFAPRIGDAIRKAPTEVLKLIVEHKVKFFNLIARLELSKRDGK